MGNECEQTLNTISHQGDEKQNHSNKPLQTSLLVRWLRITLTTQGTGSIPDLGRCHVPWSN